MPTGADYVRDERRRLANLIVTTDLWPQAVLFDGSGTTATTDTGAEARLRELDYVQPIDRTEGDIHRRFQIMPTGHRRIGGTGGVYSNAEQDVVVEYVVRVGYVHGGGDAYAGNWAQLHEVALQDAEAIRQRLEHPTNRAAGGTGLYAGITTGRTVVVSWRGTTLREDTETMRLISETTFDVHLRVDVEVA